jgi:hypothetical protein
MIGGGAHVQRLVDAMVPRLTDSNSKINVQAIETLQVLMPRIRAQDLGLQAMPLVSALATNLAAQNQTVRVLSEDALKALVSLAAREDPLSNQAMYANARGRPFLVATLAEVLDDVSASGVGRTMGAALTKHVLPMLAPLLEDSKLEVRRALHALVQSLYRCLGPALFSQPTVAKLPPAQLKRIEEMTAGV